MEFGMNKLFCSSAMTLALLILPYCSFANSTLDESFPLRHVFTNLQFINSEDLNHEKKEHLIIDVRSNFEFEILHIDGAINIPISDMNFIPSLKRLTDKDSRPVVFYCNGIDCKKSYSAAIKARAYDFLNVKVYDSGMLAWAKKYPKSSVLLGNNMNSKEELISDAQFLKHNLPPGEFMRKIGMEFWILDIREHFQRDIKILENITYVTSINKFDILLKRAKKKKIKLLIYDAVGRQVRWVQYLLERKDFEDYFFLKGGVKNFVYERDNQTTSNN